MANDKELVFHELKKKTVDRNSCIMRVDADFAEMVYEISKATGISNTKVTSCFAEFLTDKVRIAPAQETE